MPLLPRNVPSMGDCHWPSYYVLEELVIIWIECLELEFDDVLAAFSVISIFYMIGQPPIMSVSDVSQVNTPDCRLGRGLTLDAKQCFSGWTYQARLLLDSRSRGCTYL